MADSTYRDMTVDERTQAIDAFHEMYYTVECNECGERITGNLLASDFYRPGLMNGLESYPRLMEAHNMTHYVKPTLYNCEEDDDFDAIATAKGGTQ
jgi:hypothetical protein